MRRVPSVIGRLDSYQVLSLKYIDKDKIIHINF